MVLKYKSFGFIDPIACFYFLCYLIITIIIIIVIHVLFYLFIIITINI